MNKPLHIVANPEQAIELAGGQQLEIRSEGADSIVSIRADGTNVLSIRITDKGAELVFEEGIQLRTPGNLTLDGERVCLKARQQLRLESGGEIAIHAKGDLYSEARIQTIRATLGNVNLKANDDVKLRAERILLNT